MKMLLKTALVASIMSTTAFAAMPANAKIKEMKFHQVTSKFEDIPAMNMEFSAGKWKWTNRSKTYNSRIKVYFKTSIKADYAEVALPDTGMLLWRLPKGYATKKYEKLITASVGKTMLSPLQGKAAAICDVFGGSKKTVRDMNLTMRMHVKEREPGGRTAGKNGTYTVKVVCQSKPSNPTRVPVDLKVSQIKLYTIPAKPACGKPVKLVTEIWTNKPGKVPFVLERNDGATQKASVTTGKVKNGYVKRWAKTYTFKKSVNRKYRIVLAKQAKTSNWTSMKLSCGAGADVESPGAITY